MAIHVSTSPLPGSLSEKYIKKLETPTRYARFINILLSMIIRINSWNDGVTCEKGDSSAC